MKLLRVSLVAVVSGCEPLLRRHVDARRHTVAYPLAWRCQMSNLAIDNMAHLACPTACLIVRIKCLFTDVKVKVYPPS